MQHLRYSIAFGFIMLVMWTVSFAFRPSVSMLFSYPASNVQAKDTPENNLPYPIDDDDDPYKTEENAIDLDNPEAITETIEYDPESGNFVIIRKIGDHFLSSRILTFDEYLAKERKRYLAQSTKDQTTGSAFVRDPALVPKLYVGSELFDRVFGGSTVEIRPRGNIDLSFGMKTQNIENPVLTEQQRKQGPNFDFDMGINISVLGKIGEKLKLTTNYNTGSTFDFDKQKIKLEYVGFEDDIIKLIEAGNVSMSLPTSLIPSTQSLFGLKTKLQFGRLNLTLLASQQKSQIQNIKIQGGSQQKEFEITADKYDENRHFFLAHYFRDNYEEWLKTLPVVNSPIRIEKIEVYRTNARGATTDLRDVVAFMDLGEETRIHNTTVMPSGLKSPANEANDLYNKLYNSAGARDLGQTVSTLTDPAGEFNFAEVTDFSKTRLVKLSDNDFTLNAELGYISLNQSLNPDDVLAVSFQYTLDGKVYQVGEFSESVVPDSGTSEVLFLKMLKSTSARPALPIWDLMMKNIYSLGAFQISEEDFRLDITYLDPGGGEKRYIPDGAVNGRPLIKILNLDNLNRQGDPQPDGVFDFVSGITINPRNGRLIFPVVEPFGDALRSKFIDQNIADRYVYDYLYDSTKVIAQQFPQFNRFNISGSYKSSSGSEIYLGAFNLPKNSVKVTAGGQVLTENVDYTVDYSLGRVKIINEAYLNSSIPIDISYENNALFSFNQKNLLGVRADYYINDNFNIGATYLRLNERPFTPKVNVGDDPKKNSLMGADLNYTTNAPYITRWVDLIPGIDTKEPSSISVTAEVAHFNPEKSKLIEIGGEETVYIDDFEGSASGYDLKFPFSAWNLASTPSGAINTAIQPTELFPEAGLNDSLPYGFNRAKFAWYTIDPLFLRNNTSTPDYMKDNDIYQGSHYVREIQEQELFPNKESDLISVLPTFDFAYYPDERGPYNFETAGGPYSAGIDPATGKLLSPSTRWGGIQRSIETTDFEAANIEFIEFWVMDPYLPDGTNPVGIDPGYLTLNLGNVSEDVLKDSRLFFENGLPTEVGVNEPDETTWANIPTVDIVTNSFDTDPDNREKQDRGYDGLNNTEETVRFQDQYLDQLDALGVDPAVKSEALDDPSNDDYDYYRTDEYDALQADIPTRYKNYNDPQGNSPVNTGNNFNSSSTNIPETEDLNRDYTLSEFEEYFQYTIPFKPNMQVDDHPFLVEVVEGTANDAFGNPNRWLHFKVPIEKYDHKVGGINDFKSIRFMRLYMNGFEERKILRMAKLEMVRNQWRRYQFSLRDNGEYLPTEPTTTSFNLSAVSIEENSSKDPVNYVLPPDIQREQTFGSNTNQTILQNEQALSLEVCNLEDGDSRAIYKTLNLDIRKYGRLKMNVHANRLIDAVAPYNQLQDGDLRLFIRIGRDFTENYYEYEIPLTVTPDGSYTSELYSDQLAVWPNANLVDLHLEDFVNLKQDRNLSGAPKNQPYTGVSTDGKVITIVGNPDMGYVKTMMIGVRNPKAAVGTGEPVCGEIWVNELRLTDIDQKGGWAAITRVDVKAADFAKLAFSASMHTIGFGTLEDRIEDRFQDNFFQFDASASFQLGKFFPKEWGVRLPMFVAVSQSISNPEYDPYDLDVTLKQKISDARLLGDKTLVDNIKRQAQDYTSNKSINFSGIKISPQKKSPKKFLWDLQNFDVTYAYSERDHRDPLIEFDEVKRHKAVFGYGYSIQPKYIYPLKGIVKSPRPIWKPLKEMNFNLVPSKLGFGSQVSRQMGETLLRDFYNDGTIVPTYDKYFNWTRNYDFGWNLSKGLKLTYQANNRSQIDEPYGLIDSAYKKALIRESLLKGGRNLDYRHNAAVTYTVPFKQFTFLDYVNGKFTYRTDYMWTSGPLNTLDTLGNVIRNNQTRQFNGGVNMTGLYSKLNFLQTFTSPTGAVPKNKKEIKKKKEEIENPNEEPEEEPEEKKKPKNRYKTPEGYIVRAILAVKKFNINYTESRGSVVPGFMPKSKYFGMTNDFSAPGYDYVFGKIPSILWLDDAADKGWLSTSTSQNQQFVRLYSERLDYKANLEPVKGLRIDLEWKKNFTKNFTETYRVTQDANDFEHLNPKENGTYTISFFSWGTLFDKENSQGISETFKKFEENRTIISNRLASENPFSSGNYVSPITGKTYSEYAEGYGPYSQDVLIPAFIAAYANKNASDIGLDVFNNRPKVNWRLTFNGLSNIPAVKKIFNNINISHGYKSTLTVNSFESNLDFDGNYFLYGHVLDTVSNNYYAQYQIPQVVISEQLSPLIGIDLSMKNGLTARFDFKKTRNLAMSFVDYQLVENKNTEFTIAVGYKTKGLIIPFKINGSKPNLKNDVNFAMAFSLRDDKTTNYKLDQNTAEPTRGMRTISVSPTADYVVNKRLNIQLFFDYRRSIPATSASYPITNSNGGVKVRFTLAD